MKLIFVSSEMNMSIISIFILYFNTHVKSNMKRIRYHAIARQTIHDTCIPSTDKSKYTTKCQPFNLGEDFELYYEAQHKHTFDRMFVLCVCVLPMLSHIMPHYSHALMVFAHSRNKLKNIKMAIYTSIRESIRSVCSVHTQPNDMVVANRFGYLFSSALMSFCLCVCV